MKFSDIIIIGAGAAGLMAASGAGKHNSGKDLSITILEKMPRPGRKIMITGQGLVASSQRREAGLCDFFCREAQGLFIPLSPQNIHCPLRDTGSGSLKGAPRGPLSPPHPQEGLEAETLV